jgi:hypothetical protein
MINIVRAFKVMIILTNLLFSTIGLAIDFPEKPSDAGFFIDKAKISTLKPPLKLTYLP